MKVTADTITDTQLRIMAQWESNADAAHEARVALGEIVFSDVFRSGAIGRVRAIRNARARCAEILNERAEAFDANGKTF